MKTSVSKLLSFSDYLLTVTSETKEAQIREHVQKIDSLEDACQDLDNTIGQFRELVMQLQRYFPLHGIHLLHTDMISSELDNLRTQTQTARNESASAASQTAAMMSLNLKLQSTASKNQAKNIELEIKKLEARETRELLGIVQVDQISSHGGFQANTLISLICPNYMLNLTVTRRAVISSSSAWPIKQI
jgi:hypothetical protein